MIIFQLAIILVLEGHINFFQQPVSIYKSNCC